MEPSALPADLSQYINDEIAAGAFASADDLLAAAVREYKERKANIRTLKAEIDKGFAEIERGEGIDISDAESRNALREQIKQEGRRRAQAREALG